MAGGAIKAVAVSEGMAVFCSAVLAGASPGEAARKAGYSDPAVTGQVLIRHPQVRKALAEGAAAMIECELVPLSLKVARDILKDTEPKAVAVRAKLALGLLDRAAKNAAGSEDPAQALTKLSTEQLAALVAKGMAAEAAEARTVDVTPRILRTVGPAVDESLADTEA